MDERILKWLFDVKIAITEIESYFENSEMDFFKYKENLMLKRAVERDLEIIGEAGYFGVMVPPVSVKQCHFERYCNYIKKLMLFVL